MGQSLFTTLRRAIRRAMLHMDVADGASCLANQRLQLDIDAWRRDELTQPRYADSRHLNRFEHKVYSQDGGDGLLAEIYRRIGEGSRYFVEFGVGNGLENNSTYLLVQGWSGLWIEGSADSVRIASATFAEPISDSQLTILNSFITAENIEQLFREADVPTEPALLSIDIDGNDYWVWNAIQAWQPRVVEIEYNSVFPADARWVMDYNPEHAWGENSYFGASLRSLVELGESKGYELVGCALAGTNAFFVRKDLIPSGAFAESSNLADHYQPPRYFLASETAGHPRAYGGAAHR